MSAFSREMDEKIANYSRYLETVSPSQRPHIQFMIHSAKLMKKKLTAMFAELDVLIAENHLRAALEQLETFKKDHSEEAGNEKTTIPESAKPKTQKEPKKAMPSTDTAKNDTRSHTITGITNKENTKPATNNTRRNKTSQDNQKIPKTHTHVPDKGTKRQYSDSSRSIHCEKKQKKTHTNENNNDTHTSTLLKSTMSPIQRSSQYITQGVQTCNTWQLSTKQTVETNKSTQSQRDENIIHRTLEDDERTIIIEDMSTKASSSHKDAINVSKAFRQIMSPSKNTVKTKEKMTDLTQSPVSATIQLLFEEEPAKVKKKAKKVKVKAESGEIGDDVFIL